MVCLPFRLPYDSIAFLNCYQNSFCLTSFPLSSSWYHLILSPATRPSPRNAGTYIKDLVHTVREGQQHTRWLQAIVRDKEIYSSRALTGHKSSFDRNRRYVRFNLLYQSLREDHLANNDNDDTSKVPAEVIMEMFTEISSSGSSFWIAMIPSHQLNS